MLNIPKKIALLAAVSVATIALVIISIVVPVHLQSGGSAGLIQRLTSTQPGGHIDADDKVPIGEHGVHIDEPQTFEIGRIKATMDLVCTRLEPEGGFIRNEGSGDTIVLVFETGTGPCYEITGISLSGFGCLPCGQCYDKDSCDKECGCGEECKGDHCHMPMGAVKVNGPGAKYCLGGCNFGCRAWISASYNDKSKSATVTIADLAVGAGEGCGVDGCFDYINISVSTKFVGPETWYNGFASGKDNLNIKNKEAFFNGEMENKLPDDWDMVSLHGYVERVLDDGNGAVSASDFALKLKQLGFGHRPIYLMSCSTGKYADGFASQLSQALKVPVKAPRGDSYLIPSGKLGGQYHAEGFECSEDFIVRDCGGVCSAMFYPDGCNDRDLLSNPGKPTR